MVLIMLKREKGRKEVKRKKRTVRIRFNHLLSVTLYVYRYKDSRAVQSRWGLVASSIQECN
jgi:hypothetical protein